MVKFSANKLIGVSVLILAILASYAYLQQRGNIVEPGKRTVQISYSFTISDISTQAEDIHIWVPIPPSNEHQQIHTFQVLQTWPYRIVNEPEYGNRFIIFDLMDIALLGKNTLDITVNFDVTRYAIGLLHKHSPAEQASDDQLARYLAADRLIPIDGKIAQEAQVVAGHLQNPLKQIRSIYDHIVDTITYDKSGIGWGCGDALYACNIRKGNCTEFHSLFIGQARALGIPVRFIMGLPLPEGKMKGFISGYHCWAEFYLPERGWLPIDASEASKFPQKKEMFFGGLDEHRVAFTLGRDIKLPDSKAEPLNYVIYPHVEINGKTHKDVRTNFYFRNY
jgi:hypothetical protein